MAKVAILIFLSLLLSSHCPVRDSLISIASKEIGVIETSENDGVRIRQYLGSCDITTPAPWCACFINWCYNQLGLSTPRYPAAAKSWTDLNKVKQGKPGDIGTLYYSKLGRVGHAFIIRSVDEKNYVTIEGNTRPGFINDRDGDRVMSKLRPIGTVWAISNWIGDAQHEVQAGENLYRIALKYNTAVSEIQELNGLSGNFIRVGDVLVIRCV